MYIAEDSVGVQLTMTVGIDITAGTITMEIEKPSGSSMSKAVVVSDATNGVVYYITIANDLDETGTYCVRAKWVPSGGGLMYGKEDTFPVSPL